MKSVECSKNLEKASKLMNKIEFEKKKLIVNTSVVWHVCQFHWVTLSCKMKMPMNYITRHINVHNQNFWRTIISS